MSAATRLRIVARWLADGQQRGAVSIALGPGWAAVRPQILGLLLVLVANLVVLLAFTLPAWSSAAAAGSATRRGQQAQETLEPALDRARTAYGKVLDAESSLADLRHRVGASSGTISEIVSTVRAAVDAAGLSVERVNYQEQPVEELGLLQLQIDMPVRGRYQQLREFLHALLEGPSFLVVERIGVSTPSETDPRRTLMVQLGTSVFTDAPSARGAVGEVPPPDPATAAATASGVEDPVAFAQQLRQRLASLPPIPLTADDFQLQLERLDVESMPPTASERNLFAFAVDPTVRPPQEGPEDEEAEDDFVPEPVMPYELLGITRTDEALLATLSDGDHVHVLREGEVLPEGYRVLSINLVAVRLEAGDKVIRLSLRKQDEQ